MAKSSTQRVAFVAAVLAAPLFLAGCGGGSKTSEGAKVPKGIYTTASDCADAGKLSYEQCSELIASAVDKHEADAPTYSELRFCEAKEGGEGKCEFTANQKIRPKLMAFLIRASEPPQAVPLYATLKGEPGFRDVGGNSYLHSNEELVFSEHAVTVFERHGKKIRRHF